jgi:hypothetical protein
MNQRDVVTDRKARQGPKGVPVLIVLLVGLVLAAAFILGMMAWTATESPDPATKTSNPEASVPAGNPNIPPPNSKDAPKQ